MSNFKLPSKHFFSNLKVIGSRRILTKRDLLDAKIYYHGTFDTNTVTTPRIVMSNFWDATPVRTIGPISFYGGPPGAQKWYRGSLLTFILDSVFYGRVTA